MPTCTDATWISLAFMTTTQGSAGLYQGALFYTMSRAAKARVGLFAGILQTTNGLAPMVWLF